MKRALTALCLLLILTVVSTGSGIAWAGSQAQDLVIQVDQPAPGDPALPGDTTVLLGDPDDAITGNRGPAVDDDGPPLINTLNGVVDESGLDWDAWYLMWMMLLDLGLI